MSAAIGVMRQAAAVALQVAHEQNYDAAHALGFAAVMSRDAADRHLERGNVTLFDAGSAVARQLEASRARLVARRAASPIPESRIDAELPAQSSEWFECDRPGCDTVMGVVGDPDPDDEWDDYDPIAEHIAGHARDDAAAATPTEIAHDVAVQVVAETLANGAPHPHHGKVGVVLEVADRGPYPVRVQLGERAVRFATDELEILPERPGPIDGAAERNRVSPDGTRQIRSSGTYS